MTMPGISVAHIEYAFPTQRVSLEELDAQGKLESEPAVLAEMGFTTCMIADGAAHGLAMQAVGALLESSQIDPTKVDLLVNATALPISALVHPASDWGAPRRGDKGQLELMAYSSCRLQYELGLTNARALGVGEMASMSMLGGVHVARAVMELEGMSHAICVNADVFPPQVKREIVYNVISDGACAVLLSRDTGGCRLGTYDQVTKGFYWNTEERQSELIAAYFVTAKRLIQRALGRAGLDMNDIDLLIPHNVSLRSWDVLADLLHYPREKIFTDNITRQAHSVASDNFINLKDALDQGRLRPGQRALMFCFGLGAHWACQIVEV